MFPKPQTIKDPKYLDFIRTKDCLVGYQCSGDVVPHHISTRRTCSDHKTIPLCYEHHVGGNYCIHKLGKARFGEYHTIDLDKRIEDLNGEYKSGM